MRDSEPASSGLLSSLRNLLDHGLAAAQNRTELLAVEFQEEKEHVLESGAWIMATLFFAIMVCGLVSAIIIWLFPEDWRIYAAAALALIYLVGGVIAFSGLRRQLRRQSAPFSASIDEIRKDREWLLK